MYVQVNFDKLIDPAALYQVGLFTKQAHRIIAQAAY